MKGEQEAPLPPVRSKKSTKKLKVPKTPKGEAVTVPVIEAELDPAQKDRVSEAKKRRTIIDEESKLLEAELRREQLEDRMDNITPWDSGRTRWNRRSRHDGDSGLSKEDFKKMGKMEAQIEQFKESEESVSSQGETITDLMEQLETKDRLMFEQMRLENENRNRDKDRSHDKEMEMMRQMAEDRRLADNRYHELQIASLRTEMKHEGKNDPLVEAVNRGMDSVDRYLGILFSSGSQPPPQLPRVVAPGLVSISEMVAKENPGMVEAWSGESHE
jgi:predicted RNase H-like HicB family nuclease